jgi:hypothetical protein
MMKGIFNKSLFGSFFMMLLSVLAVALGADSAFAMSVVDVTTETTTANTDDTRLDTQLDGKAATATHATETEFEEEEIEQTIAVFRPYRFPLEYDIIKNAQQVAVKSYHPIHYRSGSNVLEAEVGTAVTAGTTGLNQTIVLPKANVASGVDCLTEWSTVYAMGVKGYDVETGTIEDGDLCLFVTAVDSANITLMVLNPQASTKATLPVGTKLVLGTTAGYEAQMVVEPDNFQPVPVEVYLQKKLSNIVFTDEWLEQAKKVPFIEKDIRNNALFNFKRKNARTHWLGTKKRIKVKAPNNLGEQYVYFEQGVLRQIPMFYPYANGILQFADLNAIAKMQFAKYSANNEARVYCGKNAIERLLNIDMTVHKEVKFEDVNEAGMTIRKWKNNFGTLEFVHDPTLDDIGYEDFFVVVDIKNAVRYVKRDQRTDKQDMKKGTGEVQEAQREIFSMIDCIALKGYNAILVGPSEKMGMIASLAAAQNLYTTSATLSAEAKEGTVILLTADANGFAAGTIVTKKNGTWVEFEGEILG